MRILDFSDSFESDVQPTTFAASGIAVTPTGGITSTDVQSALAELDTKKMAKITSVDQTVPRFSGTGGALQDSGVTIDGSNNVAIPGSATINAGKAVVDVSTAQTLTNKTLTAPVVNSPTGIVKGDVGLGNVDNTSDATKNSAAATLTNKTFGDAPIFSQIATPSNPSAGFNKIYPKSDGKFYTLDSSGTEVQVGSGSGGTKNYLSTYNGNPGNGDLEFGSTAHWTLGTIGTLTNGLPTGTPTFGSGASANLSIGVVTSGSQLSGKYSMSYVSSAATTQGNMVASDTFALDASDQTQVLGIQINYKASVNPTNANWSGTSSNSFAVALWDVTNSAWIPVVGAFNLVGATPFKGTVQIPSNTTQCRLCFYNANATSGAITVLLDDFTIGPQISVNAPAMADSKSFTATGSWSTNTTYTGLYSQLGEKARITWGISLIGTPTSASLTLNLPSGLVIDTAKLTNTAGSLHIDGSGLGLHGGTGSNLVPFYSSSTSIGVGYISSTTTAAVTLITQAVPVAWGSGDKIEVTVEVPIVGWSSNTVSSADTDTRVVDFKAENTTTGTTVASATNVQMVFPTVFKDTHGAWNASTNTYTVPVSGDYEIDFTWFTTNVAVAASASAMYAIVKKNGSIVDQNLKEGGTTTSSYRSGRYSGIIPGLVAGDQITFYVNHDSGTTLTIFTGLPGCNSLNIRKISGPAVVQAEAKMNARYTSTAGQSIPNGSTVVINFDTKDYDSHSRVTTGSSWNFKASTGKFAVKVFIQFASGTFSLSTVLGLDLYKNGSLFSRLNEFSPSATAAQNPGIAGSDTVNCLDGDLLDIRIAHGESTARSLQNIAGLVHIAIEKVG